VAKKGAICPIFEGNMPLLKKDPFFMPHICGISWSPVNSQKWNLLLDARDDDDLYLIAYDAVYEYADETSLPLFMNTNLPINLFEMAMRKLKQSKLPTQKQHGTNGTK
jgi:hypothetical protein